MGFGLPGGGGGGFPTIPGIGAPGGSPMPGIPGLGGGNVAPPTMGGMGPMDAFAGAVNPLGAGYDYQNEQKADKRNERIAKLDEKLGPRPELGGRNSMLGPNGQLQGGAYLDPNQYRGNQGALNLLNQKAMQQGTSPWAMMQMQKQGLDQQNQMNSAARQAQGQNAQARAGLAMRGGLSGGAAERLARGGGQDLNAARQGISNQGMQNRMQIGIQDETNKNAMLGQAVQGNQAALGQQIGLGQFNVQNTLAENQANNQHDITRYQEQMKGYAAGKTANATANSGKK